MRCAAGDIRFGRSNGTPPKGGGTTFPDVGLEVAPIKGNGVFFS